MTGNPWNVFSKSHYAVWTSMYTAASHALRVSLIFCTCTETCQIHSGFSGDGWSHFLRFAWEDSPRTLSELFDVLGGA